MFKWEISLGTVIQLATLLVLASAAYHKFDARISHAEELLIQERRRVDEHEATLRELRNNLTRLTTIIEERTKGRL